MNIDLLPILKQINIYLGWPLIIFVVSIAIICTIALGFVQCRYFFKAWKLTLFPEKVPTDAQEKIDMTPFQAFVNALSTSLGNGSIAGMAVAMVVGGPGAAFWMVVVGILTMAIRFSEIFLSTYFRAHSTEKSAIGGPMLYLKSMPGGKILSWLYAFFCLAFGLIVGNAMQTNSVRVSALKTFGALGAWKFGPLLIAILVTLFVAYVVMGGAPRVVKMSNRIVPLKVGLFFTATFVVLAYNYQTLLPALQLIISSAFTPLAMVGGTIGFTIQHAMRVGMFKNIAATESGLGTSAIFFGATGSKKFVESGIMSMLVTFISTLVGFLICWAIIASGAWESGLANPELTSTALTIEAYSSAFGALAGWMVSFLSITFGIGVIVGFVYICKECWLFLTNKRFARAYDIVFCLFAFAGALVKVNVVWESADIIMACMLVINMSAILYLLPTIRKKLAEYKTKKI